MLNVRWVQHPIGHGGFHTGHLEVPGEGSFNWAFDCGSRRTAKFDEYLEAWCRRSSTTLDWLFISHFDTDHVSGLDVLMSRTVVHNVMVPYLNEREFAYLLLREIARENLDRMLFDLAADPTRFFVSRGANRVVFLRGRQPDDEPGLPEGGDPDGRKDERDWYTVITPPPSPMSGSQVTTNTSSPSAQSQVIDGGLCEITLYAKEVGIRLRPYRAPTQPYVLRGIIKAIQNLVGEALVGPLRPGLGALAYAVARHARTAAGRAGLRNIYKHYVGSSNRASLSLLSVPVVGTGMQEYWSLLRTGLLTQGGGSHRPAWLNTGDAELLEPADLLDWIHCYQRDLPQVRALALPHHGSDKNSDAAFQALCPKATLVAHVRKASRKHPGDAVIVAAGNRLASVTEELGSAVTMTYRAS